MKSKSYFLLSLIALLSCQQHDGSKKVHEESSNSETISGSNKPIEVIRKNVNLQQTPNVQDSAWVFRDLKENPYPYDTELSSGYYLKHRVYRSSKSKQFLQTLTLMLTESSIKEFDSFSYGLPYKNIGYIGADFKNSFAFVQSYGSGNPHDLELIDKPTGEVLAEGIWVDANEKEEILIFLSNDTLKIYDIRNNVITNSFDFNSTLCAESPSGLINCVRIDTITPNEITLSVDDFGNKIEKKYHR